MQPRKSTAGRKRGSARDSSEDGDLSSQTAEQQGSLEGEQLKSQRRKIMRRTSDLESETDLEYYTKVVRGEHRLVMLKIAGDGSCLFASIVHQLEGHDIRSGAHRIAVQRLRREIVDFLALNWRRYEQQILAEATALNAEWPNEDQKEAVIERHIRKLRKPRTWGGCEVIAATTDKLRIIVRLFTSLSEPMVFDGSQGGECREAMIFYNGEDHYDSIVGFGWSQTGPSQREARSVIGNLAGWRFMYGLNEDVVYNLNL